VEEIADYNAAGTLLRRYVHGPGVDEYLVMYTGTGTANKSYYHANHQGSIVAMSDAAGNVTEQHSYDSYGNSNDLTGNPFRYTGRRLDAETGLYYYRARYYSPSIGRFLQTDPIGYGDGLNWYAYVGNDPLNNVDYTGALQVDAATAIKYPKAAKYLNNKTIKSFMKYSAFLKYGQATRTIVNKAFTPNAGLKIVGKRLPDAWGDFKPNVRSQTIEIGNNLLGSFEKGEPGAKTILDITVEHEGTHYFDDQNGKDYVGEEGELYEKYVYGKVYKSIEDAAKDEDLSCEDFSSCVQTPSGDPLGRDDLINRPY